MLNPTNQGNEGSILYQEAWQNSPPKQCEGQETGVPAHMLVGLGMDSESNRVKLKTYVP